MSMFPLDIQNRVYYTPSCEKILIKQFYFLWGLRRGVTQSIDFSHPHGVVYVAALVV
jgi:hypothetical protein